ncbi:uncharacterized protein LOC101859820 [Aplysia californica]|uniref:Uncharacterized protein LOC101859820 n=1 Tax=Aplysia californica TaxID=6500 RepID=A0ABM0K6D2_APLCA|nr:uncharacterized protein LOC101859820 [Aplysia californica]
MVTYITLERAVHIVFPFKGTEFCKPSLGKLAMPVCVIGPFVVMSYLPVVTRFVPGVGCATRAYPEMYYHFVTATAGVSMLPLTIIFACNMTIVASLHRQKGNLTSDPKRSVRFRRVTNMIIAVSVAFLATVFPQAANALMTINHPTWAWLRVSDDVTAILWELNYAINFYLYIITGRSVRREIMQILSCGRGQTKGEDRKQQAKGEDSNKTSTTNT